MTGPCPWLGPYAERSLGIDSRARLFVDGRSGLVTHIADRHGILGHAPLPPLPPLLVEIASPSTRRRDRTDKREFYLEYRIADCWIVDGDARTITVVRPD